MQLYQVNFVSASVLTLLFATHMAVMFNFRIGSVWVLLKSISNTANCVSLIIVFRELFLPWIPFSFLVSN